MAKKRKAGLNLIKKANNLIEARYRFDIWETRFFLSVLAQIHKDDDDFKVYRISLKDVKKNFGLKTNQAYDLLREGASSLMKKPLYANYETEGTKRTKEYHIIRSIDYLDQPISDSAKANITDHEYIDVRIEPDMKPLLLDLRNQGGFTFYELNNVIKLGVYPLRIYELLKQYQKIGHRKMNIDEIKVMFEMTNEYPLFANFYQRVINPAIDEINQFTDLTITKVEKVKTGRKVTALYFEFHIKNDEEKQKAQERPKYYQAKLFDIGGNEPNINPVEIISPISLEDQLFIQYQEIVVKQFGVSPSIFLKEIKGKSKDEIEKAIRVTNQAITTQTINNLPGFFIKALKEGYTSKEEEGALKTKEKDYSQQRNKIIASITDAYRKRKNDYFLQIYDSQPEDIIKSASEDLRKSQIDPIILKLYFDVEKKEITYKGKLKVGEILADQFGHNQVTRQKLFSDSIYSLLQEYNLNINFNTNDELEIK